MRQQAREQADKVITLTVKEARRLGGMLGKIVPVQLTYHSWYACEIDGVKTFYIRQEA